MENEEGNYFDIETYSKGEYPNAKTDKIISIQIQKMNIKTGDKIGDLTILKEWEKSEEEIIKLVYKFYFSRPWEFKPIGFNLYFEWQFLKEKFKQYNLKIVDFDFFFNIPQIDLKSLSVIKKGEFKGASLSFISDKKEDGNIIKELYENKEFIKIENYIIDECDSFIKMYKEISKKI